MRKSTLLHADAEFPQSAALALATLATTTTPLSRTEAVMLRTYTKRVKVVNINHDLSVDLLHSAFDWKADTARSAARSAHQTLDALYISGTRSCRSNDATVSHS